MSGSASFLDALSDEAVWRLEEACCRFEESWQAGHRPRVEDALTDTSGPERAAVLCELLRLDVFYRRATGETPRQEEYAERFPEAAGVLAEVFEPTGAGTVETVDLGHEVDDASDKTGPWGEAGGSEAVGPAAPAASRYRQLRFHAAGNLGEVYVAEDTELNRKVALKEIQARHAHRQDRRLRFMLEGEVTGGLEHPGIVPVYGMGTHPDGRPYYAMRFIQGETLGKRIARFHTQTLARFDSLEFRQLLARFLSVCQAIGYAHSRGVLHRDLKPDNIMLGTFGETLVVDWGLAKFVGRPDGNAPLPDDELKPLGVGLADTEAGAVLGTPAFMSPEQAAGRVDSLEPATDVYALGATLYALLTGRPPFTGAVTDVLSGVQKGAWSRPSGHNPAVPPALEAICVKAMALSPHQRYPSAVALGHEVEQWLADEPVEAYPEPRVVRLRRWMRKHPRSVTAICVALIAAVIGLAAGALFLERSKREAQEQFRITRKAAQKFLVSVNEEELIHEPGMQPLREKLLIEALDYYTQFLDKRPGDPEVRQEQADAYRQLGELYTERGKFEQARAMIGRSVQTFEELRAQAPTDRDLRRGLAQAYLAQASLKGQTAEPGGGLDDATRGVELLVALSGETPDDPALLKVLGRGYQMRASLLRRAGLLDRAIDDNASGGRAYWTAIFLLFQEFPGAEFSRLRHTGAADNPRGQFLLGYQVFNAWLTQGELLDMAGRKSEAAQSFATAARSSRWLQRHYTFVEAHHPRRTRLRIGLAVALLNGGRLEVELGRPAVAQPMLQEALDLARGFALDSPAQEAERFAELLCLANGALGECLLRTGQTGRAGALLREADGQAELLTAGGRGGHSMLSQHAKVLTALAQLSEEEGRLEDALRYCERARVAQGRAVALAPWDVNPPSGLLDTREFLARVRARSGKIGLEDWVREQRQLLDERGELARRHPALRYLQGKVGASAATLANLLLESGRAADALAVIDSVLPGHERLVSEERLAHRLLVGAQEPTPKARNERRELVSGLEPEGFPRYFTRRQPAREPEDFNLRRTWAELLVRKGLALAAAGQLDAARACVRRAVGIAEELTRGDDYLFEPLSLPQPVWPALALQAARREPVYLYDLACHLALVSTMPGNAPGDDFAERAVVALRDLVAAGFAAPGKFATDPRLAPLHHRKDFQGLIHDAAEKNRNPMDPRP